MEAALRSLAVKIEGPQASPNEHFRLLVESAEDYAIFVATPYGRIGSWNAGAEQIFGYTTDEIIGEDVSRLYPHNGCSNDQWQRHLASAAEAGQLKLRQSRVRKNGSRFSAVISIICIRDSNGDEIGFAHILREVGSSLVEQTIHDCRDRLQSLKERVRGVGATQMTKDTRNQARIRQMEAEKTAAEKANKAKDEFLAMLSHELRTPLTPALAAATYLADVADLPQDFQEEVATIRRNIQLEARLIDDLLDFTRLIGGKVELHFEVVDAHRLIHEIVEVVGDDIIEKELDVKISMAAPDHHIWADPVRIRQVFWNLVRNAAKFTPARGHINIRSSNTEEGRFQLEVADTGVGIELSEQTEIFSAFRQESRSITREFGGLGLGLTISKSLMDLHHGIISLESRGKDCGASFKIVLDAVQEKALVKDRAPKPGLSPKSLRLLVVEDHDDTRRTIARLLTQCGHKVSSTDHVESALKLLDTKKFDAVISDIGLPDRSGYELIAMAKQRHPIKGIALSGFGMEEDIRRSFVAGFDHHLTKPVDFRDLRAVLNDIAR